MTILPIKGDKNTL